MHARIKFCGFRPMKHSREGTGISADVQVQACFDSAHLAPAPCSPPFGQWLQNTAVTAMVAAPVQVAARAAAEEAVAPVPTRAALAAATPAAMAAAFPAAVAAATPAAAAAVTPAAVAAVRAVPRETRAAMVAVQGPAQTCSKTLWSPTSGWR